MALTLADRTRLALAVPFVASLQPYLLDERLPGAGVGVRFGPSAGNGAGGAHASAVTAVMELAGYLAVAPSLGDAEHAVTVSSAVQLVRAVPLGEELTATGVLDRRSGRLAFLTVTAFCEDVVARLQLTKAITERR